MEDDDLRLLNESIGLKGWSYSELFTPAKVFRLHPVVDQVEAYISSVALDQHPFFERAKSSSTLLMAWASQELVMTNAFSQIVLFAASKLRNVHVRAVLAEVAYGEHGKCRNGLAAKSHPWLLDQLRRSIGLKEEEVRPLPATIAFIERLGKMLYTPLSAVAGIGVGNERLIEPEYLAIKSCFEQLLPDTNFSPFLDANLNEDRTHSRLCYEAASSLICSEVDAANYFKFAKQSIDSRITYFDDLLRPF